ncbi:superoxide dismutase family protein [Cereibacter sediminicola]|uniref:superoxide dismutase family protein n=1 Tax=Cereibacter sediminicola TaxID=2584941 RepID=UPI0011A85CE3|nr:superoxide dismutase family protein [Cereibacter sediminicola]
MHRTIAIAAAALLASPALVQPALAQDVPQHAHDAQAAPGQAGFSERRATFINSDGTPIGTAQLAPLPHGVLITLDLQGLPAESWLGFHIHENGECDQGNNFESAGGHFALADTDHGLMVETGPHAGDMPNQYVGADGILRAQVFNTFVQLGSENDSDLAGRALMLHSGPDDYVSQPAGDAGDRIACAVIE